MENKRILVIGGTGYIGTPLVSSLIALGYKVTVLSRKQRNDTNKIHYILGNMLDKNDLIEKLNHFDLVIFLAAIIRTINKTKYRDNYLGLKNVLEVMGRNNIPKILYFSTQSVLIKKTGPYGNSKKHCEKLLCKKSNNYTIIRPNYVYGIDKKNDIYKLARIMSLTRIAPLIGNGSTRIQPLNKQDLVNITLKCINNWTPNQVINVAGNTTISFNQIVKEIKRIKKISCLKLHIPLWFVNLFRWLISFDIDGYTKDRVFLNNLNVKKGESNFNNDLIEIIKR